MPHLFDAMTLRGVTFNNRVWVSPMCQYSAKDGLIGAWHQGHLMSFATGMPGLIMAEVSCTILNTSCFASRALTCHSDGIVLASTVHEW